MFILITLSKSAIFLTPTPKSVDGYFGVDPVYLDGISPNDYFVVMWDELGAKTLEELAEEKAKIEKEHAEAVRREEERLNRETEKKRNAEEAVKRMKNMEVRVPSFPKPPKFYSNMEALASLDLYIDSLDSYFKDVDREFSKVNFDFSSWDNHFVETSDGIFIKTTEGTLNPISWSD